jgi:hypothetical protein
MKRYVHSIFLALAIPLALFAQAAKMDPAMGTWKLDVAKSKFKPGPPPQSITVTIAEGGKVSIDEVGPDGKPISYSFTPSPGTAVPITGMENSTVTEKRIDDYHVEHTWKLGEQTMTGKGTIAKDGKTMKYVTEGTNREGKPFHNVEIYKKQ